MKSLQLILISMISFIFMPGIFTKRATHSGEEECIVEPAVVTSYNIRRIITAMQRRGIERAQAAGWNNFRGTYVVYSNGAVTPPVPGDLPNIGIFFKKYRDCREKIVFLTICEEVCKKNEPICNEVILRPNPCSPVCIPKQEEVCNPSESKCLPKQSWFEEEKHVKSPCTDKCRSIPKVCKKCITGPLCSKRKVSKQKGSVTYTKECISGQEIPVITIDCSKKVKTRSISYLKDGVRIKIAILNNPALLSKIREFAEERLGKHVCLYVDSKSRAFILNRNTLYQVCITGNHFSLKKLNDRQKKRVESKGLYNIILN